MAFDYDVVIVGSGPAGLAAGVHLGRAGHRALVLEKELYGGNLQHTTQIDDYPGSPNGITGAQLAGEMLDQATASGVTLEQGEVSGVEIFSKSRWVACSDGRGFSCGVVILACGTHYTKLGLANEEKFRGRGVVDCTPCDAGFFVDREVVVYGSHDYALRDALYLAQLGARVTVLSPDDDVLTRDFRLKVHRGVRLDAIVGSDRVEGVRYSALANGAQEYLPTSGVLIRIGTEPSSDGLEEIVELDSSHHVITNAQLETSAPYVLACGDVRSGTRRTIAAAVDDGARAAARARAFLASG
jgi:thioredoxin reductase (NADPH)